MAKFCSEHCEATGSICDFCTHYIDDRKYEVDEYAGVGICDVNNEITYADCGRDCVDFECFRIGMVSNEI